MLAQFVLLALTFWLQVPTLAPAFVGASLVVQMVKNLPTMQETQVRSLDREYPLEEGIATHSSILAWGILWTQEPGRPQRVRHD